LAAASAGFVFGSSQKDEYRNKGYAKVLVNSVESEATKMGCRMSHLDTFDFQAKELL